MLIALVFLLIDWGMSISAMMVKWFEFLLKEKSRSNKLTATFPGMIWLDEIGTASKQLPHITKLFSEQKMCSLRFIW